MNSDLRDAAHGAVLVHTAARDGHAPPIGSWPCIDIAAVAPPFGFVGRLAAQGALPSSVEARCRPGTAAHERQLCYMLLNPSIDKCVLSLAVWVAKEWSLHEQPVRIDASRKVVHVCDGTGEPL